MLLMSDDDDGAIWIILDMIMIFSLIYVFDDGNDLK